MENPEQCLAVRWDGDRCSKRVLQRDFLCPYHRRKFDRADPVHQRVLGETHRRMREEQTQRATAMEAVRRRRRLAVRVERLREKNRKTAMRGRQPPDTL